MNLTNAQYDALMRTYEDRQFSEKRAVKSRADALYEAHPLLLRYKNALTENSASRVRARILNDTALLSELTAQADAIRKDRDRYVSEQQVDLSVLEPRFVCPDCRDTGYIDGKKCHCFIRQEIDLLYHQSNLSKVLADENFSKLDLSLYDSTPGADGQSQLSIMQDIIEKCHGFVRDFDNAHGNLLFYGQSGLGKTFLSNCIAKELLDTCHSVVYFSAVSLFEHFSEQLSARDEDSRLEDDPLYSCDLLIIDDLGTETPNAYTLGKFFSLINDRLLRSASTVISTNLTLNQLSDRYTERTASRIIGSYDRIRLTGQDLRIALMLREKNQ